MSHKVKLPTEQEDHLKRPAYIVKNDAGVTICENRDVLREPLTNLVWWLLRLQYLLVKGAVLRKGCAQNCNIRVCFSLPSARQRSTAKFWWLVHWSDIFTSNLNLVSKFSQSALGTTSTTCSAVPLTGYMNRFHVCHYNFREWIGPSHEVHRPGGNDRSLQMDSQSLQVAHFRTKRKHT